MSIYVPSVMWGLRLFIVVFQELHCLLHICMIRVRGCITSQSFVTLHLLVSEIANVLPEAVYCCFTRTTLFTTMCIYCYDCGVFIEKYVYTKFRLDWLLHERVTWPSMPLS